MNYPRQHAPQPAKRSKIERGMDNLALAFWIGEKMFWYIPWSIGVFVILRKGYKIMLLWRDFSYSAAEIVIDG